MKPLSPECALPSKKCKGCPGRVKVRVKAPLFNVMVPVEKPCGCKHHKAEHWRQLCKR